MNQRARRPLLVALLLVATFAVAGAQAPAPNTLTAAERAAGWRLLFDGTTLGEWRGFKQTTVPASWQAMDGALTRVRDGGDLVSVDEFRDFEFRFEWQVAPGANSGVMYYVTEAGEATYHTGPEYQILDNARHADGKSPLTSAASCYALYAPNRDATRPVGEWNESRLVVNKSRVEHWLNGEKVVEYQLGSPDWNARVAGSKFNEWKQFGTARRGHLVIQEHGDRVAYRNLKVKRLN